MIERYESTINQCDTLTITEAYLKAYLKTTIHLKHFQDKHTLLKRDSADIIVINNSQYVNLTRTNAQHACNLENVT